VRARIDVFVDDAQRAYLDACGFIWEHVMVPMLDAIEPVVEAVYAGWLWTQRLWEG